MPTLSLLDERGEEVEHLVGFQAPAQLRQAIERTMAVACAVDAIPGTDDAEEHGDAACTVGKAC